MARGTRVRDQFGPLEHQWAPDTSIAEVAMNRSLVIMLNSDDGVTAIEYGLLGALIAVVIVVSVNSLGNEVLRLYANIANKILLATS